MFALFSLLIASGLEEAARAGTLAVLIISAGQKRAARGRTSVEFINCLEVELQPKLLHHATLMKLPHSPCPDNSYLPAEVLGCPDASCYSQPAVYTHGGLLLCESMIFWK